MAVTIDGTSGLSGVDGSASTPALQGSDTNTGISFGTDTVNVVTGGSTRTTVDSSGRLLVGTSTASGGTNARALIEGNTNSAPGVIQIASTSASPANGDALGVLRFSDSGHTQASAINCERDGGTWTSGSSQPTRLVFSTTADGASSQTERMRITSGGDLRFNSGYGSVATAYGCRAWVKFNGTGTVAVQGGGNVSSVTDRATGKYTVNFTNSHPDDTYSFAGATNSATNNDPNHIFLDNSVGQTTSALAVNTARGQDGGIQDARNVYIATFR